MNKIFVFAVEHCVICGAVIPEGHQICPQCERTTTAAPIQSIDWRRGIPAPDLKCKIGLLLRGLFLR